MNPKDQIVKPDFITKLYPAKKSGKCSCLKAICCFRDSFICPDGRGSYSGNWCHEFDSDT